MARGMIMKEDAKRLVVNNSQSAYSYWAARYTYTVDGKEYRKRFSCDNRHSTRSKLRTIINVYWLDDPNKPFWDYSSDSLGAWFGIFTMLFPWIGAILIILLLGGADAIVQYNNSRMRYFLAQKIRYTKIQWLADFCYLHFDKLFMPDATQSQAPYSLLHSLIFQTH